MKVIKKHLPDNLPSDTHTYFTTEPAFITIHWIGPYPGQTPDIVRDHWIASRSEASAHVIIKDDEVMECWPLDKMAYHAGHAIGNKYSIGIELIPEDTKGKFSKKTIETLKEYIKTYLPNKPIVRHYDWSGKLCPAYYCVGNNWTELKEELRDFLI